MLNNKLELTSDDYAGIFKIVCIFAVLGTFIVFAYQHGLKDGKEQAARQRMAQESKK
jgi:hypothetical protein